MSVIRGSFPNVKLCIQTTLQRSVRVLGVWLNETQITIEMFSLCRLCADCKDLEELTTEITELEPKLAVCCSWFPSENESQMPQKACITCVEQLEKSWCFAEGVKEAEIKLNKLIKEQNRIDTQPIGQEAVMSVGDVASIKFDPDILSIEINEFEIDIDNDCHPTKSNQNKSKRRKPSSSPIPTQLYDEYNPTDGSANEYDDHDNNDFLDDTNKYSDAGSSNSIKSEETSNKCTVKKKVTSGPFLAQLDVEDRLIDGTISVNGVAKLEKFFPEMKTMAWADCEYKCNKCDRLFKGPQNFYAHNRSLHFDDVQTMVIRCFYCKSKHRREYTLSQHIARKHFLHLKYRCWYCSDYFWDNSELIKHRNMHTNIEYLCELCDQVFMSRDILYSHISQLHQKKRWAPVPETKYTCDMCSKDFATKWSIKSHMLQHFKKFDYVCDQCGWKFLTKGNLKSHLQTTHSDVKNFVCKECNGRFKTKHQLTSHSKRHEDIKAFACKVCDKRFRLAYGLTVHMRCHNNTFTYDCKYCDRKFRHSSSWKTHERTHTADKPYRCLVCEYRSTNWPNLNKHSVRIHSVDLRTKKNQEYLQRS